MSSSSSDRWRQPRRPNVQMCPCGRLTHAASECYCWIVDRAITVAWQIETAPFAQRLRWLVRGPKVAELLAQYEALRPLNAPPVHPFKALTDDDIERRR